MDVDIVPADTVPPGYLLTAIATAFDLPLTMEWFHWKHRDGPWGASWGRAALDPDDGSVLGVRLMLPWRLRSPDGGCVVAHRAVEAATVPRARGAGIFSRLNQAIMDELTASGRWTAMLSTPNGSSRGGYRKLGWDALGPLHHAYRAVGWRRAVVSDVVLLDDPTWETDGRVRTDWDAASLRWRSDPRSGHRYRTVALRDGEGAGLVYRLANRRRVPVLLPLLTWGERREREELLGAVARLEGVRLALEPVGPGTPREPTRRAVRRGGSLVMVWEANPDSHPCGGTLTDTRRWALDMADLESVL